MINFKILYIQTIFEFFCEGLNEILKIGKFN